MIIEPHLNIIYRVNLRLRLIHEPWLHSDLGAGLHNQISVNHKRYLVSITLEISYGVREWFAFAGQIRSSIGTVGSLIVNLPLHYITQTKLISNVAVMDNLSEICEGEIWGVFCES